jgi:thyrotropin-releasing hormone receptor
MSSPSSNCCVSIALTEQVYVKNEHDNASGGSGSSGLPAMLIDDVPYSVIVNGFLSPLLIAVTLVTNVCVCAVLVRPNMRSATNVLLVAMAVSDTLTGLCPLPAYFRFFTFGDDASRQDWLPYDWCYAYYCLTDHLPTVFHTASVWLTVALAVQRYIFVCRSLDARRWCTVRNSLRVVAVVYIVACLYQFGRFVEIRYSPFELPSRLYGDGEPQDAILQSPIDEENATTTAAAAAAAAEVTAAYPMATIEAVPLVIGCRYHYRLFLIPHLDAYFNIYYWFRVVAVHLVPCSALVALNAALVVAMRRAQARRRLLLAQNRRSESRRLAESNVTTMMLVAVVGVFLVVEFPLAVLFIVVIIENTMEVSIVDPDTMAAASLFVNLFILLSYPVNFFIYCGMSRQFRSTLQAVLLCRSPPPDAAGSMHAPSMAVGCGTGGEVTRYMSLTPMDNGRTTVIQQTETTRV